MEEIENLLVRDDWWNDDVEPSFDDEPDIPDWYDNPD